MITHKQDLKRRIVICGSMSFYSTMLEVSIQLNQSRVPSVVPDIFAALSMDTSTVVDLERLRRKASLRHIRRVRDQRTFAVLAVNLDKYDIPDYIGPQTFAEIAIATAHYKSVYLLQGVPAFYRDELMAWGVRPLDGSLDVLTNDYCQALEVETRQLNLFPGKT
jgi:hypothetical protein